MELQETDPKWQKLSETLKIKAGDIITPDINTYYKVAVSKQPGRGTIADMQMNETEVKLKK